MFHVDITSLICHFARGFIGFVCICMCICSVSRLYFEPFQKSNREFCMKKQLCIPIL